ESMHSITVPHFHRFKADPLGCFDRFIERIQGAVQYQSVVVIIDEFQLLCELREEVVSRAAIFNNLRSLSQHGHGFHLILSGSGLLSRFVEQSDLTSLLTACYEEKLG